MRAGQRLSALSSPSYESAEAWDLPAGRHGVNKERGGRRRTRGVCEETTSATQVTSPHTPEGGCPLRARFVLASASPLVGLPPRNKHLNGTAACRTWRSPRTNPRPLQSASLSDAGPRCCEGRHSAAIEQTSPGECAAQGRPPGQGSRFPWWSWTKASQPQASKRGNPQPKTDNKQENQEIQRRSFLEIVRSRAPIMMLSPQQMPQTHA